MAERRTIGQVLKEFGRISEEDVQRALAHQQEEGGYFGEALLALKLVTQEELEWGVASQFDLPYVFPDVDSIDPEAVGLVNPEWALAHLALPIMRAEDTLTVIVDSPFNTEAIEELRLRTGLEVERALASAGKIRELIRQVYSRNVASEDRELHAPVRLPELVGIALDLGAARFGVSVRGARAIGWYAAEDGSVHRRPLGGAWRAELGGMLEPPPGEQGEHGGGGELTRWIGDVEREEWYARLDRDGVSFPVLVRHLSSSAGAEYLLEPVREGPSAYRSRFPLPPQGLVAETRLLARSGSARFLVAAEPEELGREIVPYLSSLLLGPEWRSVHLTELGTAAERGEFSFALPEARETWQGLLRELEEFHFDAACTSIDAPPEAWLAQTLEMAPAAFILSGPRVGRRAALDAGIRWELSIAREEGDRLDWQLSPLQAT